jgi:hypothetical protein
MQPMARSDPNEPCMSPPTFVPNQAATELAALMQRIAELAAELKKAIEKMASGRIPQCCL